MHPVLTFALLRRPGPGRCASPEWLRPSPLEVELEAVKVEDLLLSVDGLKEPTIDVCEADILKRRNV